jgi:AraC family transcriptional regulator
LGPEYIAIVKPDTRSFYVQAVQGVVEHVAQHLDEALDLETLTARACLSPFHFHRVFRGMVGETAVGLIRRLRMERAAWRLAHTSSSITEIAFGAGFETHEAFTRTFRACYAASPTGFRQQRIQRIELAASCGVHFDHRGRVPQFIPRDSGGRNMDVEIKQMPEQRVGTVRHIGPYNQISEAFGRLGAIAGPAGLFARPGVAMIALYHDDPESTPADRLRSDAALAVPGDTTLPADLVEQRLPAGRYASTMHVGAYEQLGDTWARFLGEWLPSSGKRMADGPSYELYLNDPTTTPKDQLRTEIYVPIAD